MEKPMQESWRLLLLPAHIIRNDSIINERLLDLVHVFTIDSIYKRKTERHRLFGLGFIRLFGVRWVTIDYTRKKFIGTERDDISIQCEAKFTERDINWDLYPHTEKYLALAAQAYQAQISRFKGRRGKGKEVLRKPPYAETVSIENASFYRIHPELTPPTRFLPMLNDRFYPCMCPNSLKNHPNFGELRPTIGVYGPWVLDCNHRCHPEIHPYEWIWWLDLNPQKTHPVNRKVWFVGLMRDVSKRFKNWSFSPRTGRISIPFIIPDTASQLLINVEHMVYSRFHPRALKKLSIPEGARQFNEILNRFSIEGSADLEVVLKSNHQLNTGGIRWWFGNISHDTERGFYYGRLHIAASVESVWTAKVAFEYE